MTIIDNYLELYKKYKNSDKIPFIKCHALGNDFILIDDSTEKITNKRELAIKLCNRHEGIGADDLIIVKKGKNIHYMEVYNPDGSICSLCGNALRCTAAFLFKSSPKINNEINILTGSGMKKCIIDKNNNSYKCDIGIPQYIDFKNKIINTSKGKFKIIHINVGVPHTILFVNELDNYPVNILGPEIENNPLFPQKTNVMFVKILSRNSIKLRCWERGMTGETFACGTGACASTVASYLNGLTERKVKVLFSKGSIEVLWNENNNIYISGSASFSYTGIWNIN